MTQSTLESLPSNYRLLVAIPCLNEDSTIAKVITAIPKSLPGIQGIDVLVIDDGSTDNTTNEARGVGAHVIRHSINRGVGVAFQTAVDYAIDNRYDVMVNIDGDGQFSPEDIGKLIYPVLNAQAEMATASRFVDTSLIPDMPKTKLLGNKLMSFLISRLVGKKFYDVSCGFRCYSREALLRLTLHGSFTYTQETFLDFAAKGIFIIEVPIKVRYFPDRKSRIANSLIKYGIRTSKIILRGYRDYFPLRFFWAIAGIFFIPAAILALIFFVHFWTTGFFSGYLYAGFISAFFLALSTIFFVLGIVADMLDRIRSNQEKILYFLKKDR